MRSFIYVFLLVICALSQTSCRALHSTPVKDNASTIELVRSQGESGKDITATLVEDPKSSEMEATVSSGRIITDVVPCEQIQVNETTHVTSCRGEGLEVNFVGKYRKGIVKTTSSVKFARSSLISAFYLVCSPSTDPRKNEQGVRLQCN